MIVKKNNKNMANIVCGDDKHQKITENNKEHFYIRLFHLHLSQI